MNISQKFNIIVFGDSHVRSFNSPELKNIVFAGSGKELNFLSLKSTFSILKKVLKVNSVLDKNIFFLVFGEPDIRFLSYGTFYNKDLNYFPRQKFNKEIRKSLNRYKLLINALLYFKIKLAISAVHTPNEYLSKEVFIWNSYLKQFCQKKGLDFFELTDYKDKEGKTKKEFVGFSIHDKEVKDHIHLSKSIGEKFYLRNLNKYNFSTDLLNNYHFLEFDIKFCVYKFIN